MLSTEGGAAARRELETRAQAVRDEVRLAAGVSAERHPAPAAAPSFAASPAGATALAEPPAVTVSPPTPADVAVASELASIKKLVGQVLTRTHSRGPAPEMPDALFAAYTRLLEAELADELADEIVADVRRELDIAALEDEELVRRAVAERLSEMIPSEEGVLAPPRRAADGRPHTVALVGPTGVGKTTTIAKLAASYKLRHGKRVGLITADTYRIAAVDQLRTYANIIGLPLEVATTPADMAAACRRLSQRDVILIDTAGRNPSDDQRIEELRAHIAAADPHETHLVLSGAASERVMINAAERFEGVHADNVIFTKLDETVGFGVIVNAARRIGMKLSFVTTGQEVPDHIEPSSASRLATLVLTGELER